MLSRKFIAFLLIVKMATSQSLYPTTAVTYSTNSVPTIQTYPASVPTVMSAMPAITTAVPTSPIPATCAATVVPYSSVSSTAALTASSLSSSPTVSVTASPVSSVPTTEPKAYFLPANIPDPKVTVLSNDKPGLVDVTPFGSDRLPSSPRKDVSPMSPVKRMTMACTDDVPAFMKEHPVCPGISKMELTPPPSILKKEGINNPIDFEGLLDSFMTCL